ncbi:MFS general substrate transporter [Ramaria rubella]|nr:MFS general substrate transporter [Ramaria rubella]
MALPYFLRNFIPKKEKTVGQKPLIRALLDLTWIQWAFIFSGWLAWTCDAMDFFSVSLAIPVLSKAAPVGFGRDTATLSNAITLTLLFRSVGAVIFGIISDRYGRKWPLVSNLLLCCVLQIGSSFCNTYRQFLGVRSLFGIAMGGIWGLAIATALENVPVETRGFLSGVLQEGYAVGYLLAAVVNLTVVQHSVHTWRTLFWVAAGLTFFAACVRAVLPESAIFLRAKEDRRIKRAKSVDTASKTRIFFRETKTMLKEHWILCIYAVLLMTGFNFLSHGSQDLYPTYIEDDKLLSSSLATKATIIGNCGAVAGGAIAGFLSQYLGRRLTIIVFCCLIGAFIPLWILPTKFPGLAAGAFFIQIGVQGAWGVIPIFLNELSPPAFRATFPGVAYQVGNMVSSSSARIEAVGAENLHTVVDGKIVPDYAKVQGILIGVVTAFVVIVILLGPENHSSHFEKHRVAFEEGAGRDDAYVDEDPSTPETPSVHSTDEKEKTDHDQV